MNKNYKKLDEYNAFARVKHFLGRYACSYCTNPITDCTYELDHVFPNDKDDSKMLSSCRTCNADKTDNSLIDYFLGDATRAQEIETMVSYTPSPEEVEDARQFIIATHVQEIRRRNRPLSYNELRFFNIPENRAYAPKGARLRLTQTEHDRFFKTYHNPNEYQVYIIRK